MSRIKESCQKPRRLLRGHKGMTIAETLLAVLIVSLLSMGIATGVAFGANQYRESMTRSEAKILCSTLASNIRNELEITTAVFSESEEPAVFLSQNYLPEDSSGKCCFMVKPDEGDATLDEDVYGNIVVADKDNNSLQLEMIPDAAYSTYGLSANVQVYYFEEKNEAVADEDIGDGESGVDVGDGESGEDVDDEDEDDDGILSSYFTVEIKVVNASGKQQASASFYVIPLNKIQHG